MQENVAPPPGRGRTALTLLAIGAAIVFVAVLAAVTLGRDTAARAVARSVARGLGYDVTFGALNVTLSEAMADGVRVTNLAGEPVLDARRIDVVFSLRDLLPGGRRLFGLESVQIDAPHVTVIHHADGTYNITLPPPSNTPARANAAALNVRLRVSDGSVDLIDRYARAPRERRERLAAVHAQGVIAPAAGSRYAAGAELEDGGARYPIRVEGRFDDPRGFELQQVTAARLPIADLANFALSTHALVVQGGELRNLDLKLGALASPAGAMQSHLGIRGDLAGLRLASPALAAPVRDGRGSFVVDDDAVALPALDAAVNGIPLHVSGVLYHFAAPHIRFAIGAHGDLSRVRGLARETARLPLAGAVALNAFAEGSAANPLVFARISSPHATYGTYRFDGTRGFAALSGQELDVIGAALRYGTIAVGGRAAVLLRAHTQTTGYATLAAPANSLPYVDRVVPGMPLDGIAAVGGRDAKLHARGYVTGRTAGDAFDAPFAFAATGSGTVGPVVLRRHDGASIFARAAVDAAARQSIALIDVRGLTLLPAPAAALPGLTLPVLPPGVDAKLDATAAALVRGTQLAAATGRVHVRGAWGDVRAVADGSGHGLAARGRALSSFERLRPFTGDIGARGGIDVPFALTNAGASTLVQIAGARFPTANVRGIALQAASATLGIAWPAIRVYAADVRVDGHDITAAGSFGDGGRVRIAAGDVDLRALSAAGVPIEGGRATVLASVGGTPAKPTADAVAVLSDARYARADVGGDIGLRYDGAALRIDHADVSYGGTYANATGVVDGLAPGRGAPRYDLRASVEDADIATLATLVKTPLRYPEGTLDAEVRVRGAGSSPNLDGELRLPEGSINGLSFRDAAVALRGNLSALEARRGRVSVGSTTLTFSGSVSRTQQSVRLRSDALDLADFNDYFDESDVLAGTGRLALAFDAAPRSLMTSADLQLGGAVYRRFTIGTVAAQVGTAGTTIRLRSSVDGANGRATIGGAVNVPVSEPLRNILTRSYVDLQTQVSGVDLGRVLPAAGLDLPLLGTVDGAAVVRGRYPGLALTAHAALANGVAGRVPIEHFSIAATALNGHGRLSELALGVPGLTANATGSFGLRPQDAFAIALTVSSPDINELITTATGKNPGVKGAFATHARLTGTIAQPQLAAAIDLTALAYHRVMIPAVHADVAATRANVDVRNGKITLLNDASIAFDGHAPLGQGTATPIALDVAPHRVDILTYADVLPDHAIVSGLLDGNVSVRGTRSAPKLGGALTFTNGSFKSDSFKNALTDITLDLEFSGTSVRVARLHAVASPGSIDGGGTLALRDLRDPVRGLTANVDISVARAYFALPKYYSGTVDGQLTLTKRIANPLDLAGDVTLSNARIPYTALLPSGGTSSSAAPALPAVAFDLGVDVARDVRVQSGPVDIGTTGSARLGGTLAKPTLDGQFTATNGTVSLYRTFNVQNGSAVTFNPADGVTPSVDATAVTNVPDPPTDVLLHVTGLADHLNLAFSSQPSYSEQQILGLLVGAQALGAVSGVAQSSGGTGGVSIAGIGEGVLNTQLTQKFLQPFSSALGGALGLSDLNLGYSTSGAVSATAQRKIGKNIAFVYSQQIGGTTPRASFGINVGNTIAGAQLTFFQTTGAQAFGGEALTPYQNNAFLANAPVNYTLQAIAPPTGSGFVFSYQRHYW